MAECKHTRLIREKDGTKNSLISNLVHRKSGFVVFNSIPDFRGGEGRLPFNATISY